MKNLYIVDGASGSGKSFLVQYVLNYKEGSTLVRKFSTRSERAYERNENWRLDLDLVDEDKFDKLELDYTYLYGGKRYGFSRKTLKDALRKYTDVFVIVRNSDLIRDLQTEWYFINVVPIFIYTDRDMIKKRLALDLNMTEEDVTFRLSRLEIAFTDYLTHPDLYAKVLINNGSVPDFHRLVDLTLQKHRSSPDIDDKLAFLLMSFNPDNPQLRDYAAAIKRSVKGHKRTLRCINLDDVRKGGYEISKEAKEQVRRCRFAVVDLTENKPNVYYELGFVHGISKDCILTCHKDTKPHFYPAGHKIIFYENASELEEKLAEEVRGLLDPTEHSV